MMRNRDHPPMSVIAEVDEVEIHDAPPLAVGGEPQRVIRDGYRISGRVNIIT